MADEKKDATKEAAREGVPDGAPAAKSRLRRMAPLLVGGVVSAGLGVTAGIVTQHAPEPAPAETPADASPFAKFKEEQRCPLPMIVVNLADTGQSVACKAVICLAVRTTEERAKGIEAELGKGGKHYMEVRDALRALLTSKISTDLKTPQGTELLKLEIIDRVSPLLFESSAEGVITNVFFEDLLVQFG